MSDPQPAEAVKLLASLFSGNGGPLAEAMAALCQKYGRADFISAPVPFGYTDYYEKEFGAGLIRRFVSFERLIRPETLPEVKTWTNALEKRLSVGERRGVNIDPGYLAKAHLILATGKGYTHRPYLRDGIYADLTLMYRDRTFHPLPWTYPDYASEDVTAMLIRIREKYLLQLKGGAAGDGSETVGLPVGESEILQRK